MIRRKSLTDAWIAYGIRRKQLPVAYRIHQMRKVRIVRDKPTPLGTFGVLTAGTFSSYSLEPNDHANAQGISSIPFGVYQCALLDSPKFGLCYHLADVPGRTGILIHRGNFGADEGHGKTDTEGCILLGNAIGEIAGQRALLSSKDAVARFESEMEGEPFELEIESSS